MFGFLKGVLIGLAAAVFGAVLGAVMRWAGIDTSDPVPDWVLLVFCFIVLGGLFWTPRDKGPSAPKSPPPPKPRR